MSNSVKKRETFYLSGYDPRGARHYYNLYKKEAALQSEVNGMKMDISSRKRTGKHIQSWHINSASTIDKVISSTDTNYSVLEWDDITRKDWKKNFFSLWFDLIYAIKIYILSGIIFKYGKISPRQMIAAFYPVAYVFLTIYIAYILWLITFEYMQSFIPYLSAMLLALIPAYVSVRLLTYLGNSLAVFWLLRIYVFSAKYVHENMEELEERIEEFATHIANVIENAKENEIDEILIVSHSVGTILTIPIMAKALSKVKTPLESMHKVSILTLGECIPVVSFLKEATEYREYMHTLASKPNVAWLDYTSAIDGACFPLLDYYKHSGVHTDTTNNIDFLSPRFHTLFSKQSYAKLRSNRYLAHFLYLMSTEIAGTYDFFKMTAGHARLSSYINTRKKL